MKVGIMQPYFFPYLGYFQLIYAVDRFVVYDDVNFITRGWINRNFVLGQHGAQRITLQLSGASQNKLINEIEVGNNSQELLKTISQLYSKAPYYDIVFPVIESCLRNTEKNAANFLSLSLRKVTRYLGIATEFRISSEIKKDPMLKGSEKIIAISKQLGASKYINAIGGQTLYDKEYFIANGVELFFLQTGEITYNQFGKEFIPNLSIIDVMMFNSPAQILDYLSQYTLI